MADPVATFRLASNSVFGQHPEAVKRRVGEIATQLHRLDALGQLGDRAAVRNTDHDREAL